MADYGSLVSNLSGLLSSDPAAAPAARPPVFSPSSSTSSERLAILGDDVVAASLRARAEAAGWSVDSVTLFPGQAGGEGPGLGEQCVLAVSRATVVAITTPATSHNTLSVLLRDCVPADAIVLLVPGQTGGALEIAHSLRGMGAGPTVAELSWRPWASLGGAAVVEVPAIPLATVPAEAAPAVAGRLAPLFDAVPVSSALWTGLHAPDLILRTIPSLLAAGVPDHGTPGRSLGEILSRQAARGMVTALELDRLAVAEAFDLDLPPLVEWLAATLGTPAVRLEVALGPLADIQVPEVTDPYWLADLAPSGLAPLCALADRVGVQARTARGLLRVAEAMLGNDYELGGRSAEAMGLAASGRPTAVAA
jgi:hypothetical protein